MERELRILGSLMGIGKAEDVLVQDAMLLLSAEYFSNHDCRDLIEIIMQCFNNNHPFDFDSMCLLAKGGAYSILHDAFEGKYWSPNTLLNDTKDLIEYAEFNVTKNKINLIFNQADKIVLPKERRDFTMMKLGQLMENYSYQAHEPYDFDESTPVPPENDEVIVFTGISFIPHVYNSSLVTVCGRSGIGKTYFAVYLMNQILANNPRKRGLFFSLEVPAREIHKRFKALYPIQDHKYSCRVIDKGMMNIQEIEIISKFEHKLGGLGVIVVDYLALVQSTEKFEANHIKQANIAQRLAALSIKLGVVVIALSQANRNYEKKKIGERVPVPADAADSSGSERSSSLWIGIDRPCVDDPTNNEWKNLMQVKVRKNRYGEIKEGMLLFDGRAFKPHNPFSELAYRK